MPSYICNLGGSWDTPRGIHRQIKGTDFSLLPSRASRLQLHQPGLGLHPAPPTPRWLFLQQSWKIAPSPALGQSQKMRGHSCNRGFLSLPTFKSSRPGWQKPGAKEQRPACGPQLTALLASQRVPE